MIISFHLRAIALTCKSLQLSPSNHLEFSDESNGVVEVTNGAGFDEVEVAPVTDNV
ncbi:hypothetical protein LC653_38590 [Nostoc sp. CHAB 5784]|uniref:hypothetical protein n=1 Tax=Nostoc mirabile TaxID=2907820 RepID=UPI001E60E688|nr:hypothetical protein [Nostoc mirabile]MCC5669575.1 hypothetical protein [Nostoc mirabile CHAB5784]